MKETLPIKKSKGGEKASSTCPNCHSSNYWKDGNRKTRKGIVKRYICRSCGYRFSESSVLLADSGNIANRQVCAVLTEAKNLAEVEPHKDGLAGATEQTKTDIKDTIFKFKWWMQKQGYKEQTIISRAKLLKIMAKRGADLYDSESIKEVIAKQSWCDGRKENAVHAYASFLKMTGNKWEPPRYYKVKKIPFIPIERELDQLIAGFGNKETTILQLLKETAMRIGEALSLEWTDIDTVKHAVRITSEKGGNPRLLPLSDTLINMICALHREPETTRVFGTRSMNSLRRLYTIRRRRIAAKLQNPRIQQITFHTFRHWKATMEYHETKDIIHVMRMLGHKNINNTLIYTQLLDSHDDNYIVKVAESIEEDKGLIEAGFEYVTDRAGMKIYRKRK